MPGLWQQGNSQKIPQMKEWAKQLYSNTVELIIGVLMKGPQSIKSKYIKLTNICSLAMTLEKNTSCMPSITRKQNYVEKVYIHIYLKK